MKKIEREQYIFKKKCLLIILYIFYLNNVDYTSITFTSFGFHFDPTCNFKIIVKSKNNHIHKYVVHILDSVSGVNLEELDLMGNINIIRVKNIRLIDPFISSSSTNIYFDETSFLIKGYIEGKEFNYELKTDNKNYFENELFSNLNKDSENKHVFDYSFLMWMLKLYHYKIKTTLVMGAGINCDYGAKNWKELINSLNLEYNQGDKSLVSELAHYAGNELFAQSKLIKTSGFDIYKELNKELYLFKEAKSFSDPSSTLYMCVDFLIKYPNTDVISYNYDTNLEYLLKKRDIRYVTVYDDTSFINKEATVVIYHVHGLLPFNKYTETKFTDSLIFNESEYFYLYNNPYSWNISKQMHDFTFNLCIFIGISLNDPNMKRLLELSRNYLKFNFIFLKKEEGYSPKTYKDITNYFFSYDLITIWIDDYPLIGEVLNQI